MRKKQYGNQCRAKTYEIFYPNGKNMVIENLAKFCRNNNLNPDCMLMILRGKQKQHKGFTIRGV